MNLFACCWSRQKDVSPAVPSMRDEVLHDSPSPQEDVAPALASVPGEVLRDILLPLNRWTLDGVQFTNRRFLQLIMERMTDVCLRQINLAAFQMPEIPDTGESWYWIRIDVAASREIKKKHEDTVHVFSEFVQALRSSCVAHLTLNGKYIESGTCYE